VLPSYGALPTGFPKARELYQRLETLLSTEANITLRNITSFEATAARVGSPRLFLGSGIMMGLVPASTQVGETICQFWNSSASAVICHDTNGNINVVSRGAVITAGEDFE